MEQFRPIAVVQQDAALASALRDGDEEAVRTLHRRYGGPVFVVALRIVGDSRLAEDVTRHVFLQAWRNSDRFEPGRDFAPWLATIARRAALQALPPDHGASVETSGESSGEDSRGDGALAASSPSAEDVERAWSVRAAVDALADDDREIVRLEQLEASTHAEIAERLDVTVEDVESRSRRAHRRIVNLLAIDPEHGLDPSLHGLLADPTTWAEPGADLGDRVALAVASEAALGSSSIGAPAARRPWLRPGLIGAAAAVLFLVGGVVEPAVTVELVPTGVIPDVGGDIEIVTTPSGLRIELQADGLPPRDGGRFYQGWLRTVDGDLVPVGTFRDGRAVTLWAGVDLDLVDRFSITLGTALSENDPQPTSSGDIVLRADVTP